MTSSTHWSPSVSDCWDKGNNLNKKRVMGRVKEVLLSSFCTGSMLKMQALLSSFGENCDFMLYLMGQILIFLYF